LRLPAADLEQAVTGRLCRFLASPAEVLDSLGSLVAPARQPSLIEAAAALARAWPTTPASKQRRTLQALASRIIVSSNRIVIHTPLAIVGHLLGAGQPDAEPPEADLAAAAPIALSIETRLHRGGLAMKLVSDRIDAPSQPDPTLIRLLVRAHAMRRQLEGAGGRTSLEACAEAVGVTASYFTRVVRLAYLAPDITVAILDGRQPAGADCRSLVQHSRLPLVWDDQRQALGFR
jgi:hypothetical protein